MLFSVSNGGCINERKTTCEIRFTNDERRKCLAGIASLGDNILGDVDSYERRKARNQSVNNKKDWIHF